ncbi:MAG: DNA mismatch repair protein MutS [Acidobacteria bacterium]|nr:MAG: DNA mismatch repair protein MutS [Acidobacteriota bacterium]
MLRQYLDLKEQAGQALLLYRMGDFYELFFEDAQTAAPLLGITLTRRRHNDKVEAPMCGVPHHAFDRYLGKLLTAGHCVAVAEQVEDPATAKGLVRREIVRTHTPGTVSDAELLEGNEHCFLAAIGGDGPHATVAWIEVSTGLFEGMDCSNDHPLAEQLARLRPKEILVSEDNDTWLESWPSEIPPPTATALSPEEFSPAAGEQRLRRVLGVASLRGFGLNSGERLVGMAGALLSYVEATQRGALQHLRSFSRRQPGDALVIDRASLRNLEVEHASDGTRRGSLLATLDHTKTRMGARLLRDYLVRPSIDLDEIEERHRAVAELVEDPRTTNDLRACLSEVPDLERLAARIGLVQALPRELAALRAGADLLPKLLETVRHAAAPLLHNLAATLDPLGDIAALLHQRLASEPAHLVGQGAIATGWDADLDEHRTLARGGRELLAGIESRERKRTGIGSLKVKYNKVFGYYLEVSKSNLDRVPDDYERRQTLTNAERYITPELKELESRILSAEDKAIARERELYDQLLDELAGQAQRIAETASRVAVLDVLAAFGDRARKQDYCRPVVDNGSSLVIRDGRHPVLEVLQRDPPFIPNDCELNAEDRRIVLLTGPNMGGKSTYLRQIALITLMAHTGSFVPAASAQIGLTDRIFTRVGASDMLAKGESTFMVEMTETANILHHATPRSLVILDEVGRGTATYDGLSLAWAIVEYFHDHDDRAAKVLFATHYHELTDLARRLPRLINQSMGVKEWKGTILFLHRVGDGPSDRSYGIHVAELAGVPDEVCRRAEEILTDLEAHRAAPADPIAQRPGPDTSDRILQMDLFRQPLDEILDEIGNLELDTMTPLEALNWLSNLKKKVSDDS